MTEEKNTYLFKRKKGVCTSVTYEKNVALQFSISVYAFQMTVQTEC